MSERLVDGDALRRKGIRWSPGHIREQIRNGAFPRPVTLGRNTEVWLETEIDAWIADSVVRDPEILTRDAVAEPPRGPAAVEALRAVVTPWHELPNGVRVRYVLAEGDTVPSPSSRDRPGDRCDLPQPAMIARSRGE